MTGRAQKYLLDILRAVGLIELFVQHTPTLETYETNDLVKSAVERQLAIIGEAISQFEKEPYDKPIPDARLIVGLRNRIVHAYDTIDDEAIWSIMQQDLPRLKNTISLLLNEL